MTDRFHFIEIDLIIFIPSRGNERRDIPHYGVSYYDRKKECTATQGKAFLKDVLKNCPKIGNGYPHTVGYFQAERVRYPLDISKYIEIRKIQSDSAFYKWIEEVGL